MKKVRVCLLADGHKGEFVEAEHDVSAFFSDAEKACIDIYMDIHVSEMKHKPEHLKKAWSVGQELYTNKPEAHCEKLLHDKKLAITNTVKSPVYLEDMWDRNE